MKKNKNKYQLSANGLRCRGLFLINNNNNKLLLLLLYYYYHLLHVTWLYIIMC